MVDVVFLLLIGIYKVGIQNALNAGWCNFVPGEAEKTLGMRLDGCESVDLSGVTFELFFTLFQTDKTLRV